jgi:hypothetical protein
VRGSRPRSDIRSAGTLKKWFGQKEYWLAMEHGIHLVFSSGISAGVNGVLEMLLAHLEINLHVGFCKQSFV